MERVTDVLNNIYNTGMGHLENRRKQRQFEMQGRQFALGEAVKRSELDQQGYRIGETSGGPYGTQFNIQKTGQFSLPKGFVMVNGKPMKDPTYMNPKDEAEANYYSAYSSQFKPQEPTQQPISNAQGYLGSVPSPQSSGDLVLKTQKTPFGATYENVGLDKAKAQAEAEASREQGKGAVIQSAEAIGGSMNRLAQGYADAYREGGVGNALKDWVSSAAIRMGGDVGDRYKKTSALTGLKTEVVARMMPLLTQQGDKAGSVRLVEAIFRKLEDTLPKKYSGKGAAEEQIAATIKNSYGYIKAFHDLGMSADQIENMSDAQFNEYINTLETARGRISLTPQEEESLNGVISEAVQPIRSLDKSSAPNWIPRGYEQHYQTAKSLGYSDEQIKAEVSSMNLGA